MTPLVKNNINRLKRKNFVVSKPVQVVRSEIHGQQIFFAVRLRSDGIQKSHFSGKFYEKEELAIIAQHFPVGGVFVDIGANIGNHTIFAAKFLHASKIHVFEPNPPAIELLEANILLNQLESIVVRKNLGIAISDEVATGMAMNTPKKNLGGSKLVTGGDIETSPADALLQGVVPDMIKIDVEGMEMRVLGGLTETIAKHRPKIFIEVDNNNLDDFENWCQENDYEKVTEFRRYKINTNFMVTAKNAKIVTDGETR